MKIGELSARTGCAVPNIRYYEEKGLIRSTRMPGSNYRAFGDDALRRLSFIMRCRANGMRLSCIRTLLGAFDDPAGSPEDICERIDGFIQGAQELERQMRDLQKNLLKLKSRVEAGRKMHG